MRYAVVASLTGLPLPPKSEQTPEIAFTFDDPSGSLRANLGWRQINENILASLASHKIKSALFVCGMRVDNSDGRQLVADWDRDEHLIANHSYSHLNFNSGDTTLAEFGADTLKNEPVIHGCDHFTRLFRYPFFKEGNTTDKRDGMRSFLKEHGYRVGRATIDASDWAISARLEKRVENNPKADLKDYRDFFLQHIWERAQFYDSLAHRVLAQTRATHGSAASQPSQCVVFSDLIGMFVKNKWKPVDADYAYGDPIYDLQPKTLPAGESLIWALAKETGKFEGELRYPGEDDVYENPRMDALHL